MANIKSYVLTDVAADKWVDSFEIGRNEYPKLGIAPWSVKKRTLHGGRRDGVDLIEVNNGLLSFSILPTRGMGIWRGKYRDLPLGWNAPIQGPVHPKYLNLHDRGGLGWLDGFNEWICRCGLTSNGPPGHDPITKESLTLHGRIANTPAHYVEVQIDLDPPYEIEIIGHVDEATMFFSNLRLTSTIATSLGSNLFAIQDVIENRHTKPAELQMLYHCNFGPPILEAGSKILAPFHEVVPSTDGAADGVTHFESYLGPTPGYAEQVFFCDLLADQQDCTLAVLHNAKADRGAAVRMIKSELPRFIIWKNTAGENEGYVTGIEPATNYPNFKQVERKHHRVITLQPGEKYTCTVIVEAYDTAEGVAGAVKEIQGIQGATKPIIHRTPQPKYCE